MKYAPLSMKVGRMNDTFCLKVKNNTFSIKFRIFFHKKAIRHLIIISLLGCSLHRSNTVAL